MASSSSLLSEEQFLCPICLDKFTKPVSTPCGHNFCRTCIKSYWNITPACRCPVCKEVFDPRPDLKANTFISGLMSHFKSLRVADAQIGSSEQQQASGGGGVLCDICTGTRREAVKSCLECLTSYCGEHLEPHHRAAGLKRHTLVGPSASLEDEVCKEHARRLTLFCRDHEALLCDSCANLHHLNHDVVPVQQASDEMRALLGEGEARAEKMIQERLQRVRAAKMLVEQHRTESEKAMADGVRELNTLVSEIQTIQTEMERVMEEEQRAMEEKQRAEEERADRFVSGVEQEISELRVTAATLKQLNEAEDPLSVLRSFPHRPLLPRMADSSAFSCTDNTEMVHVLKSVRRLTSRMKKLLSEMNAEIKRFSDPAALRHVQLFEEDVTLDVGTAHRDLIVSDDRKQVRYSQNLYQFGSQTLNPNMFMRQSAVLGDRGFQSQKFYFEVFVGEKIMWNLGVVTASIQRNIKRSEGLYRGFWGIMFLKDKFVTFTSPDVTVHLGKAKRVGVFVDYNGGQISFYDVETDRLIYAFTECSFTEALFPFFNPCSNKHGANQDPMIIVPAGREWS